MFQFLGPKTAFNKCLMLEVSDKLEAQITNIQFNEILPSRKGRRVLIYGGDWAHLERDQVLRQCKGVTSSYGPIDFLIISQQEVLTESPSDYITQVNQQLLSQFWVSVCFSST